MRKICGCVVTNGYVRSQKFDEVTALYREAAKQLGIELKHVLTSELVHGVQEGEVFLGGFRENEVDFVLFLDKDVRLAKVLEHKGIKVFNSARVIEICDDKSMTFFELAGEGIKMPKTIVAPLVFPGTYKADNDLFIEVIEKALAYPLIVKESFGSFGEQVYMVKNQKELKEKRKSLASVPHIYQEFVTSSYGKDVRVHVVGDQVVASMLRVSETDFRANISNGGKMAKIQLPIAFEALAIRVAQVLEADFVGVDLLFGEAEEPILCEVNSNAHIKNILDCTGVNVAEYIMKHIERELGCE